MLRVCLSLLILAVPVISVGAARGADLELTLRSRSAPPGLRAVEATEKKAHWDPKKTAIIVCDMWDQHWCKSAERRVGELAGPMNVMLKLARSKGVFIIHAPSTCTAFYQDTPQRQRAKNAPFARTPVPLVTTERWGTCWNWPDSKREGVLPIDDSDMGCDCKVKCEIRSPWTRQTAAIEIAEPDAITDDGQETWNLLTERGIDMADSLTSIEKSLIAQALAMAGGVKAKRFDISCALGPAKKEVTAPKQQK